MTDGLYKRGVERVESKIFLNHSYRFQLLRMDAFGNKAVMWSVVSRITCAGPGSPDVLQHIVQTSVCPSKVDEIDIFQIADGERHTFEGWAILRF